MQDTIVALQALSLYATVVYQGGVDVSVQINGEQNGPMSFAITDDNPLVLQRSELEAIPDTLSAEVSGVGCAFIQVIYN